MSEAERIAPRDWRGRFIRKLIPTEPDVRCWLIWSKKWGCWHRRSATGGANGYTSDILQAGLFPFAKAREYHDGYDNEAFHVNDKIADLRSEIAARDAVIRAMESQLPSQPSAPSQEQSK